ncbi:tyrosine-type recombinase/integrase [Solwaraspora sp. WMMD792]|uniref:tyrosine-type recombinase/integrase n=1 Tax=Solwaraspora sp. WMMD792 TaxID=3016099 RepID=UPI002416A20A|nr:tyrosine-type recombinase/integrase [Solwaraspora sp. WMMD792]MDG4770672.1 tyrosine-type recombinase/integrase [Solwaraspora sp. WMMD792]
MPDPIKRIELKDGTVRYRFVVDVGRDPETGKRKQVTHTFDGKKEAKTEYARIRHETDRGTYVRPSKMTVDQFLDEWLTSATRDVEEATAANYRHALLPVRAQLGGRLLQSLAEGDIERLVDWMLTEGRRRGGKPGSGLSARSARLTLGRLRTALNVAVRRQLVVRNVAQFVTIPRAAAKAALAAKADRTPWTEAEVKTFLAGIADERLYAVCLLSLMGLRPAEVCGLRWSDVDFDAGTLAAGDNTRTLVDGRVVEKTAKSAAGRRGLPMPAAVTTALKAFKTRQASEKLRAGEAYQRTGYVLVDEIGEPQRPDWLRRRVYELMARAGVRKVRLYDARHACLTYLATQGVTDVVLAAWAGHADGGTLAKRVYVHPDLTHLQQAAKVLDAGLFAGNSTAVREGV